MEMSPFSYFKNTGNDKIDSSMKYLISQAIPRDPPILQAENWAKTVLISHQLTLILATTVAYSMAGSDFSFLALCQDLLERL